MRLPAIDSKYLTRLWSAAGEPRFLSATLCDPPSGFLHTHSKGQYSLTARKRRSLFAVRWPVHSEIVQHHVDALSCQRTARELSSAVLEAAGCKRNPLQPTEAPHQLLRLSSKWQPAAGVG